MILGFLILFLAVSMADVVHVNHKLDDRIAPPWRH